MKTWLFKNYLRKYGLHHRCCSDPAKFIICENKRT